MQHKKKVQVCNYECGFFSPWSIIVILSERIESFDFLFNKEE